MPHALVSPPMRGPPHCCLRVPGRSGRVDARASRWRRRVCASGTPASGTNRRWFGRGPGTEAAHRGASPLLYCAVGELCGRRTGRNLIMTCTRMPRSKRLSAEFAPEMRLTPREHKPLALWAGSTSAAAQRDRTSGPAASAVVWPPCFGSGFACSGFVCSSRGARIRTRKSGIAGRSAPGLVGLACALDSGGTDAPRLSGRAKAEPKEMGLSRVLVLNFGDDGLGERMDSFWVVQRLSAAISPALCERL